jgi:hypothetical protein
VRHRLAKYMKSRINIYIERWKDYGEEDSAKKGKEKEKENRKIELVEHPSHQSWMIKRSIHDAHVYYVCNQCIVNISI